MFCYQCEQAAGGKGCSAIGVCGKSAEVSDLQDLLIHSLKGLSIYATEGRKVGIIDKEVNVFTVKGLFSTLTNVGFDAEAFITMLARSKELTDGLRSRIREAGGKADLTYAYSNYEPADNIEGLNDQMEVIRKNGQRPDNEDVRSLQDILLFGIKGIAAYADHAQILGQEDDLVYAFIHRSLAEIANVDLSIEEWIGRVLKCGEINLRAMELLDGANTGTYGHPVPTNVPLGARKGKAILVSGHDLKDLETILKQTEGKGIFVYTHGEMLPCHGYPELKKYGHFYGHYGTAWQNQQSEFASFPGAIVLTTNCIMPPTTAYKDRIFTSGLVNVEGVTRLNEDFTLAIERALALPGFSKDTEKGSVMTGFARNAVLSVADKVIDAVKSGDIRHFFLVGGCDGAKPGRNYYSEFVEKVPSDCMVLTLACGKFRFFDKDLGDIGGIPRLLDIGQCNDSYSAIQIAVELAKAFDVGVNGLPLSFILSWYEQKAVAILLTLLHLGVKGIKLGPSLPAFITPNVLNVLVENFDISPITTPDQDLESILDLARN